MLDFPHYGKVFIKRCGMVPDFFVQQAIQLAYYRVHKKITATYETGHTRLFFHGRTETIKATTEDSVAFTKAMCDPTVPVRRDCLSVRCARCA
jgi:carnitine O-acetyltransferase